MIQLTDMYIWLEKFHIVQRLKDRVGKVHTGGNWAGGKWACPPPEPLPHITLSHLYARPEFLHPSGVHTTERLGPLASWEPN